MADRGINEGPPVPQPPSLSGQTQQDLAAIIEWMEFVYRAVTLGDLIGQRLAERAEKFRDLAALTQAIGDPPTTAQVEAIQERLNDILATLKETG